MMLPGVEVARRRRVRAGQGREGAYDGGVSRSETHRSRLGVTGGHFHSRLSSTPGTSRPQAPLQLQENCHEQRSESSSAAAGATAATTRISTSNSISDTENMKADNHHHHHHHHHRSREESRGTKFSSLWRSRRQSSCSHSDPGGLAVEARYRLDGLLQAADHASQTTSSWRNSATGDQTAQSLAHNTGFTYSNSRRTSSSVYSWLAGLATCVLSVKQCLNKVEVNSRSSRSSTTITTRSSPPPLGQRRAMIRALRLPREVADGRVQDDCPVCLEALMAGETTITLLCNHTFHPQCLTPWLSRHDKCPCCRASITRHKHISHELKSRTLPRDEHLICSLGSTKLFLKEIGTKCPDCCLTVNVQPSVPRRE